ncbi:MAG TPA: ion transporter [Fimbriimonadaceae bacterium]|nr:ion transporter [Fimbriimonadaceae bacterium]
MVALAFVWLLLLIVDLTYGLTPALQMVSDGIWIAFVLEFGVRLAIAPQKLKFLARNWLTALSLILPAFRILRPFRAFRALRGARVLRVVSSLNRGMKALGAAMGRRGFGYVLLLTVLIAFGGAAGMFALEKESPAGGFQNYWDALWWTAMTLTTLGTSYTPGSGEGRVLAFLIAVYAFSVFGYLAATLASFFVERDAASSETQTAGKNELERIYSELEQIRKRLEGAI